MENKYIDRYANYIVDWFNEDHITAIDRMGIVNKISNGYGHEIALAFVQENAENLMSEIYSDCFNSLIEKAELLLIMKNHLARGKHFRKVAGCPQKYTKILYYVFFSALVDFLNNYLVNEFEVEI